MLEVQNLSFSYGRQNALSGIGFEAPEGARIAVLGPNGAGKSTLFRCILGLLPRFEGSIQMNGRDIRTMGAGELARCAAYIPQSTVPVFDYTVLEMVLMGMTGQLSPFAGPGRQQMAAAETVLRSLGILFLADRSFGKISGGERQLALIARAIAQGAKILVMDEPTANLDFGNQHLVLERMDELASRGYTVLFSTHNPDHALLYANQVLVLRSGQMLTAGPTQTVLTGDLLTRLYGVEVRLEGLDTDPSRKLCVPVRR